MGDDLGCRLVSTHRLLVFRLPALGEGFFFVLLPDGLCDPHRALGQIFGIEPHGILTHRGHTDGIRGDISADGCHADSVRGDLPTDGCHADGVGGHFLGNGLGDAHRILTHRGHAYGFLRHGGGDGLGIHDDGIRGDDRLVIDVDNGVRIVGKFPDNGLHAGLGRGLNGLIAEFLEDILQVKFLTGLLFLLIHSITPISAGLPHRARWRQRRKRSAS